MVYFCVFCVYIIVTESAEALTIAEEDNEKEAELVPVAIEEDPNDEAELTGEDTCFRGEYFFQIDRNPT